VKLEDIKQIAQSLQNFYPAPPSQKEKLIQIQKVEIQKETSQRILWFW
jgi:hypothetical protein